MTQLKGWIWEKEDADEISLRSGATSSMVIKPSARRPAAPSDMGLDLELRVLPRTRPEMSLPLGLEAETTVV